MRLTSVLVLKVAVAAHHVGVNDTCVYFDLMPQLVNNSILLELLLEEDLDILSSHSIQSHSVLPLKAVLAAKEVVLYSP
jgi:hypothetical protein